MAAYVQNWQKMMGSNYGKWIIQANAAAGKSKKVGGGKRTTVNAPRGPIREKTGGVGVTLCAVSKRPNDKKQHCAHLRI